MGPSPRARHRAPRARGWPPAIPQRHRAPPARPPAGCGLQLQHTLPAPAPAARPAPTRRRRREREGSLCARWWPRRVATGRTTRSPRSIAHRRCTRGWSSFLARLRPESRRRVQRRLPPRRASPPHPLHLSRGCPQRRGQSPPGRQSLSPDAAARRRRCPGRVACHAPRIPGCRRPRYIAHPRA